MRSRTTIHALSTPQESMVELGKSIMLTRAAREMTVDDLARACGASPSDIERVESGAGGDLLTLLRIAHALHFVDALMDACRPPARSLDELARQEKHLAEADQGRPSAG